MYNNWNQWGTGGGNYNTSQAQQPAPPQSQQTNLGIRPEIMNPGNQMSMQQPNNMNLLGVTGSSWVGYGMQNMMGMGNNMYGLGMGITPAAAGLMNNWTANPNSVGVGMMNSYAQQSSQIQMNQQQYQPHGQLGHQHFQQTMSNAIGYQTTGYGNVQPPLPPGPPPDDTPTVTGLRQPLFNNNDPEQQRQLINRNNNGYNTISENISKSILNNDNDGVNKLYESNKDIEESKSKLDTVAKNNVVNLNSGEKRDILKDSIQDKQSEKVLNEEKTIAAAETTTLMADNVSQYLQYKDANVTSKQNSTQFSEQYKDVNNPQFSQYGNSNATSNQDIIHLSQFSKSTTAPNNPDSTQFSQFGKSNTPPNQDSTQFSQFGKSNTTPNQDSTQFSQLRKLNSTSIQDSTQFSQFGKSNATSSQEFSPFGNSKQDSNQFLPFGNSNSAPQQDLSVKCIVSTKSERSNNELSANDDKLKSDEREQNLNSNTMAVVEGEIKEEKKEESNTTSSKTTEQTENVSTKAIIPLDVGDSENYDRETLKAFDKKFRDWEKQFEDWKASNRNHPDRNAYGKYMSQWDLWRRQLVDQRRFILDSMNKSMLAKAETKIGMVKRDVKVQHENQSEMADKDKSSDSKNTDERIKEPQKRQYRTRFVDRDEMKPDTRNKDPPPPPLMSSDWRMVGQGLSADGERNRGFGDQKDSMERKNLSNNKSEMKLLDKAKKVAEETKEWENGPNSKTLSDGNNFKESNTSGIPSLFASVKSMEQAFPFFENDFSQDEQTWKKGQFSIPAEKNNSFERGDRGRNDMLLKENTEKKGFDKKAPNPPQFQKEKSVEKIVPDFTNLTQRKDIDSLPPSQRPIEKIARDPFSQNIDKDQPGGKGQGNSLLKRPNQDSPFDKEQRFRSSTPSSGKTEGNEKDDKDENPFGLPPPRPRPALGLNPFDVPANPNLLQDKNPFDANLGFSGRDRGSFGNQFRNSNQFEMRQLGGIQDSNPFDLNANSQGRNPFDISNPLDRNPFEIENSQNRNPFDIGGPSQVNPFDITKPQGFQNCNPFNVPMQQKNPFDIGMPSIPVNQFGARQQQREFVDDINPFDISGSANRNNRNPFDGQINSMASQLPSRGINFEDSYSNLDQKKFQDDNTEDNDEDDDEDLSKYYTRERRSELSNEHPNPVGDEPEEEAEIIDYEHGGVDDLDPPRGEALFSDPVIDNHEPEDFIEDDVPGDVVTIDYGHGTAAAPNISENIDEQISDNYYEEDQENFEEYYEEDYGMYPYPLPSFRGRGFPFIRGRGGPRGRFPFFHGDPNHPMNFMRPRFPPPGRGFRFGPPGFSRGRMMVPPGMRPEFMPGFRGRFPIRGGRGGATHAESLQPMSADSGPVRRAPPLEDSPEVVELASSPEFDSSYRDAAGHKVAPRNEEFRDRVRDREGPERVKRNRDNSEGSGRDGERSRDRGKDRSRDRDKSRDRDRDRDRDRSRDRDRDRNRDRDRDRDRKYPRDSSPRRGSDSRRVRRDESPLSRREREKERDRNRDRRGRSPSPARSPLFDRQSVYKNTLNLPTSRVLASASNPPPPRYQTVLIEDILNPPGRSKRPRLLVIILRGLPGSGKTYAAKLIKDREVEMGGDSAPRILSIDDYFMTEVEKYTKDPITGLETKGNAMEYEYESDLEPKYRQDLLKTFKKTVENGYFPFIIVDAVNDNTKHYEEMATFATQKRFQVYIAELEGNVAECVAKNIHNRSKEEIEKIHKNWERTPPNLVKLDIRTLLQDEAIQHVEMEDVSDTENIVEAPPPVKDVTSKMKESPLIELDMFEDPPEPEDEEQNDPSFFTSSKWEKLEPSEEKLNKLDGLKRKRKSGDENFDGSKQSMEKWLLSHMPDDYSNRRLAMPGQKRVRWADIEERREQERMRDIGFVVGQTDWRRMTDPTFGSSALTKTKFI